MSAYQKKNQELKQDFDQLKAELEAAKTNIDAFETQNNDFRNEVNELREKKQIVTKQRQEAQELAGKYLEEITDLKLKLEEKVKGPKRGKRSQT